MTSWHLITSYNHKADDISTILCMVKEQNSKFLLIQVLTTWLIVIHFTNGRAADVT